MSKIYLVAFIFCGNFCFAQNEIIPASPCGVNTPDSYLMTMPDRVSRSSNFARSNDMLYIPIKFHNIGTDAGSGYFEIETLYKVICNLNIQFQPLNMTFYIYEYISYVPNSDYYVHEYSAGRDMLNEHNVPDVINVYIVSDPAGNCGYAYYPGSGPNGGGVVMAKSCTAPEDATFAHELGHYFSLPHTFAQWNSNPEYVNGSNCSSSGDYFCDTPADFIDNRWSCPYNKTDVDPVGDPYNPDGSLFMSYSNEPCPNRFSVQQQDAIRYSATYDYNGMLISHNMPDTNKISDLIEAVYPIGGQIIDDTTSVILRWKKVPNATQYQVKVHRKGLQYISRQNILTSDTSVVLQGLKDNYNFEWKVKPMAQAYTCSPYTSPQYFSTAHSAFLSNREVKIKGLRVYPTIIRSGGEINIETTSPGVSVDLISSLGSVIKTKANAGNKINIGNINPGIYMLRILDKGNVGLYRILVQ